MILPGSRDRLRSSVRALGEAQPRVGVRNLPGRHRVRLLCQRHADLTFGTAKLGRP